MSRDKDARPVTRGGLKVALRGIAGIIRDWIKPQLAATVTKIESLERRIVALETRPEMKYVGAYAQGNEYNLGEFATHGGSLWHCNERTRDRPGESGAWTLAAKRGRDR